MRLVAGHRTVEVGTRHPETPNNRGSIHTTELSAKGARVIGEALLTAAAHMELQADQVEGDGSGTAPGAGDVGGGGN